MLTFTLHISVLRGLSGHNLYKLLMYRFLLLYDHTTPIAFVNRQSDLSKHDLLYYRVFTPTRTKVYCTPASKCL